MRYKYKTSVSAGVVRMQQLRQVWVKHEINHHCCTNLVPATLSSPVGHPLLRVAAWNLPMRDGLLQAELLTPDHVHVDPGGVPHRGLAGVAPGVWEVRPLDQQEGGGGGAWQQEILRYSILLVSFSNISSFLHFGNFRTNTKWASFPLRREGKKKRKVYISFHLSP